VSARDDILGRVRSALAGVEPDGAVPPAPRGAPVPAGDPALVDLFAERVADYRAVVERCAEADLVATVAAALPEGARVVVPPGLGFEVPGSVVDDGLPAAELDRLDAVVTGARIGIAETGTIVLDHGPGQGRRAITLVPDRHVCVVRADQVVADVPDAITLLDPLSPLTWISGPSATSDIELDRVEGVHGPRNLHVIIVDLSFVDAGER
jgi:L-lactate dehydrogenase complex protein LldG